RRQRYRGVTSNDAIEERAAAIRMTAGGPIRARIAAFQLRWAHPVPASTRSGINERVTKRRAPPDCRTLGARSNWSTCGSVASSSRADRRTAASGPLSECTMPFVLAILAVLPVALAAEQDPGAHKPRLRTVDLDRGESQLVELADG